MSMPRLATIRMVLAAMALPLAAQAQAADAPADAAPKLEFAFEEVVTLAAGMPVGPTALGGRNIIPITGGTFKGPGLSGEILPGGWDWQLRRADGCLQIKADYMLKTDDGVIINVVNQGVSCPRAAGEPAYVRTVPVFEPPLGKYAWMGQSAFVGILVSERKPGAAPAVRIRFYRVL